VERGGFVISGEINRRDFVSRAAGAAAGWAAGVMFTGAADAAGAPTFVLINESYLRQKYPNELSWQRQRDSPNIRVAR
jgi:hypothetical protein